MASLALYQTLKNQEYLNKIIYAINKLSLVYSKIPKELF